MDDVDLLGRQAHLADGESLDGLADRDHPPRAACEDALCVAPVPGAERIRVVLRRDDPCARCERAVDVRVHEVRVDEIRLRAADGASKVPRLVMPHEGDPRALELLVERVGVRHVEADEPRVHSLCRERGEERQQVPLRATDSADPMHMNDPHAAGLLLSINHTIAAPAASASRKSHGTR